MIKKFYRKEPRRVLKKERIKDRKNLQTKMEILNKTPRKKYTVYILMKLKITYPIKKWNWVCYKDY